MGAERKNSNLKNRTSARQKGGPPPSKSENGGNAQVSIKLTQKRTRKKSEIQKGVSRKRKKGENKDLK